MSERLARVNTDVELCFETFDDPAQKTILLVMAWRRRYRVGRGILRDARGARLSRRALRQPRRRPLVAPARPPADPEPDAVRDKRAASYTLSDMADDAVGLLDHLGVAGAHVVGASWAGWSPTTIAIEYPERVRSLMSTMSNESGRLNGQPAPAVYGSRPAAGRLAADRRERVVRTRSAQRRDEHDHDHHERQYAESREQRTLIAPEVWLGPVARVVPLRRGPDPVVVIVGHASGVPPLDPGHAAANGALD